MNIIEKYCSMQREKIFGKIYSHNLWGGANGEYYSGAGSYREDLITDYIEYVKKFIASNDVRSIIELGCGDFHVAKEYAYKVNDFLGVDIVDGLIERNTKEFGNENVHFICKDIVLDELPYADLCLIRQVLQHCTNEEIKKILHKCKKYKYCLITECVYRKNIAKRYNVDISGDRRTRRIFQSGVYLEEPPFSESVSLVNTTYYSETEDLLLYLIDNTKLFGTK